MQDLTLAHAGAREMAGLGGFRPRFGVLGLGLGNAGMGRFS